MTPEKQGQPPLYRSPSFTRLILDEKRSESPTWQPKIIEEPPTKGKVIGSLLFYLVAAIVMVMVNKWVLNAIEVPLFFLFVQLVIAVVLLKLCAMAGFFHLPSASWSTYLGLAPLIACNCLGLAFNTYCLQYVDASFYQVARGLVLPFTVLLSHIMLRQRNSSLTLLGVALVCVGFVSGVSGERLSVSHLGVLLGILSSLTTSIHAIVVKSSMNIVKDTIQLVYLNNLLSAFVMFPMFVLAGEVPAVVALLEEGGEGLNTFTTGALTTGSVGFAICLASFLSIKVTSPVSHMVSSAVRGVVQTYLGVWCFGDVLTSQRASGIGFILAGSALYTWSKTIEGKSSASLIGGAAPPVGVHPESPPPAYSSPLLARVQTSPLPTPVPQFKALLVDEDSDDLELELELEDGDGRVY